MVRQTGRTTKMLAHMAVYITENWNTPKFILLIADTPYYAWILAEKLSAFIGGSQRNENSIQFGKVKVLVISHFSATEVRRVYRFDAVFIDHHIKE